MDVDEGLIHEGLLLLGRNIRARRLELQLTQEQLAKRAHFHRSYISDVERAVRNPLATTLIQRVFTSPSPLLVRREARRQTSHCRASLRPTSSTSLLARFRRAVYVREMLNASRSCKARCDQALQVSNEVIDCLFLFCI
ncbi:helix-turn-helix transcriptional regulator [Alloacidobacterium sp.]|uniref:helix-turn-helix domain-containing protein n=1 Tax=Alloacidobacterium sp. TaxID=2951999 RepID=UPI002D39F4B3|nr:helix-turn-helix transcriptional regulator [Alloacidobacterium sp.]HYK37481.1 helix-turn-helix transcriptional regulator [Alloacidobacterium sp.]